MQITDSPLYTTADPVVVSPSGSSSNNNNTNGDGGDSNHEHSEDNNINTTPGDGSGTDWQEGAPEKPASTSRIDQSMKPRPTAPFPGWRKPVGARSHLFGTDNDALRFGHPRSDWKKRAIPSGSSINNDDVPHTFSLSRAEGRREDPDDESSSSPVLLVTTGGGSCVFTGMTDCSVGGTAESTETTVETVNADTAHGIDDRWAHDV